MAPSERLIAAITTGPAPGAQPDPIANPTRGQPDPLATDGKAPYDLYAAFNRVIQSRGGPPDPPGRVGFGARRIELRLTPYEPSLPPPAGASKSSSHRSSSESRIEK